MYEPYYGFREKPFSILPDPELIYWGETHRLAFAMLEFGVMNNAGFTVVTGEIGSGKTTLIRHLLKRLTPDITVGLLSHTPRTNDDLLRWIMLSLQQPFEDVSYLALYAKFQAFLIEEYGKNRRTVLIVDEAQNLTVEALEELRMLSNINADKDQLLQLILVGQPQLRHRLQLPELRQFAQRVSSDFHLRALHQKEVAHYIAHRLHLVGGHPQLFSADAGAMIFEASGGIPRAINILCDTALVYGFSMGASKITGDLVEKVIENRERFGALRPSG